MGDSNKYPTNVDRVGWASSVLATFAKSTGADNDLVADPETVLADLLADLMHWCDAQKSTSRKDGPNFDVALARARAHYHAETAVNSGPATLPFRRGPSSRTDSTRTGCTPRDGTELPEL